MTQRKKKKSPLHSFQESSAADQTLAGRRQVQQEEGSVFRGGTPRTSEPRLGSTAKYKKIMQKMKAFSHTSTDTLVHTYTGSNAEEHTCARTRAQGERETKAQTKRQGERQAERQRLRDREGQRERQRETRRETKRKIEKQKERERPREGEKGRNKESQRDRERQRDRTERQRDRARATERRRHRERHKHKHMKRGRGRKEGREGERKRPGKVKQGKQVHMWQKERTGWKRRPQRNS